VRIVAKSADRIVAPTCAMRPGGKGASQEDEEYGKG
jgi:hypothetical protein